MVFVRVPMSCCISQGSPEKWNQQDFFFFVESHKEIYYKKLAHIIMEADKSLGLELANWRPRRAKGLVPV